MKLVTLKLRHIKICSASLAFHDNYGGVLSNQGRVCEYVTDRLLLKYLHKSK